MRPHASPIARVVLADRETSAGRVELSWCRREPSPFVVLVVLANAITAHPFGSFDDARQAYVEHEREVFGGPTTFAAAAVRS